ncbi:MAG TPA: hypothetical protein D7H99_02075, partial [Candidatus Poseidoniales archaeon]
CHSLPETTAIISNVNNIAPELGGLLNHGIAIDTDSLDCPCPLPGPPPPQPSGGGPIPGPQVSP